ncbi:carboxypeptidase regulatory-like domain-containing protein [Luteimonas sp. R10]|uniref:TonB-dependent receptor n=1 Tax=Luteimonas sp. R10 TaxID=3108176 RepID=UPI00308617C9|nr:TonB-dependent receptor [Luteimonas sp. R10]
MSSQKLRKRALCMAMGICLASMMPTMASAQNVTGTVVGRADAGSQITVVSDRTGLTRTVSADSNGNYRIPSLPVGDYTLTARSDDGQQLGSPIDLRVTLGGATTVNVPGTGISTLGAVEVVGSRVINRVDVTSTESATNVTREEIRRLPVDQNIASVAVLAPGVQKGDASFGGLSFGGSSVAENSVYVNGLNVTDFYNRVGYSSAPFAFYEEFQVKTGGYSVEFGRTTGGVVNAVTRSGSNEFEFGAEYTAEPSAWQASKKDRFRDDGTRYQTASEDQYSLLKLNAFASGPIVRDKLFFFAMYEARDYRPQNTNNLGTTLTKNDSDDAFWGGKLDWQINDSNLLELMAFSDSDARVGEVYDYDYDNRARGDKTNEIYLDTGGRNRSITYTSNLTQNFTAKLMYGENERESFQRTLNDLTCNYVTISQDPVPRPAGDLRIGCTTVSTVQSRLDEREAARADFEWSFGDHLLRFGLDREVNTSNYDSYYAGPDAFYYGVYGGLEPGDTLENGGIMPPGYTEFVRVRRYEVSGEFESINSAYYIEDNWSVTDNLLLNIGLRMEAFDNKDSDGNSYIEIDDMLAPRFGFSWDVHGDSTTKLYGNIGRYFLPVANVINIKQAGGFLDERTFYGFDGWETRIDAKGVPYAFPILGPQIGNVDNSQGDGSVGDLRSEVDADMDPVYQDELILGYQQMLTETWSWGVSGTYRKLNNAIDDMNITATPQCGPDGAVGWVMANPGEEVTVWGYSNCDGPREEWTQDWITIDTSREGWAMYDSEGNYLGQRGWDKPERRYKAVELQLDRAWDGLWSMNASYTWSKSDGNAEGPVNSDTDFADTGRTENFDDPWVNLNGYGPLHNDRRHQFKFRGAYALTDQLTVSASLNARSGGPITGFGKGNPFDRRNYYSYYICVENCTGPSTERVYEYSPRGGYGRLPWTFGLDAGITYGMPLGERSDMQLKFTVYNLLNHQRKVDVNQQLQTAISNSTNPYFKEPVRFEAPRYAQLVLSLNF